MKSVFNTRVAVCALAAVMTLSAGNANAADLGGNCCADLEERIAELEATTARKGNRKVSLTISGWVNEAIFFWDDGTESNVYIGTNSLEQSRVKFAGEAKIDGDWSAGYTLELGISTHPSNQWDQNGPASTSSTTTDNSITVRKSNWWVKSKTLGKMTVGLEGTATYHLLDDADGVNTRNYSDAEAASVALGAFRARSGGTNIGPRFSGVFRGINNGTPGQNGRRSVVRYDSPEIMGFVATASWGEDDMWGGALTYKAEAGDFKLIAKAGYEHNADETSSACSGNAERGPIGLDCEWFGAAGTIQHVPTGLFVYGGFGQNRDDSEKQAVPTADEIDTMWFVQAGIEKKFISLGKTTVFGEYRNDNGGSNLGSSGAIAAGFGGGFVRGSDIDSYAAGIVQNVEAAAMDLYVIYRHTEADVSTTAGNKIGIDDFDMVMTGARIQF